MCDVCARVCEREGGRGGVRGGGRECCPSKMIHEDRAEERSASHSFCAPFAVFIPLPPCHPPPSGPYPPPASTLVVSAWARRPLLPARPTAASSSPLKKPVTRPAWCSGPWTTCTRAR